MTPSGTGFHPRQQSRVGELMALGAVVASVASNLGPCLPHVHRSADVSSTGSEDSEAGVLHKREQAPKPAEPGRVTDDVALAVGETKSSLASRRPAWRQPACCVAGSVHAPAEAVLDLRTEAIDLRVEPLDE
jgi:hypothetical protein